MINDFTPKSILNLTSNFMCFQLIRFSPENLSLLRKVNFKFFGKDSIYNVYTVLN